MILPLDPVASCVAVPEAGVRRIRFESGTLADYDTRAALVWPRAYGETGKTQVRMGWAVVGGLNPRTDAVTVLAHSEFKLLKPAERLPNETDLTRIMLTWWRDYQPLRYYYAEDYEVHRRQMVTLRTANNIHPFPSFWHLDMPEPEQLDARIWQAIAEGRLSYPGSLYDELLKPTLDGTPPPAKVALQVLWTGFERNPWRAPG